MFDTISHQVIDQGLIGAILVAALGLFMWGRWRHDLVAFFCLMLGVLAGVVPAGEAFMGFGHPATVTVAAVLVLSQALTNTGATDRLAALVSRSQHSTSLHIFTMASVTAALSAFMNNVGALALMMPVALQSAARADRSPATILMPISFGAILGGLVTRVGTPPNIIISEIRKDELATAFGMFDFAAVGGLVAVAGVVFLALVGWRLIPERIRRRNSPQELMDIVNYVTEAKVPEGSPIVGKTLREIEELTRDRDAVFVAMIRKGWRNPTYLSREPLKPGDSLIIEAGPEDLDKLFTQLGLVVEGAEGPRTGPESRSVKLAASEAVIAPGSALEGQIVNTRYLRARYGVNLLGVSRQGQQHRGRLRSFRFEVGDVLLLHGDAEHLPDAVVRLGCLPLATRDIRFGASRKAVIAVALFGAAILLSAFNILPLQIAFGLAVVGVVVADIVPPLDLYKAVDWPVIVLLGSMIPLGGALKTTGATDAIALFLRGLSDDASPAILLTLLMVMTMLLTDVLNNAATAVIMAPIGLSLARLLGCQADPFLMAVAVGSSCAFLTPIGHQNNTLIMGPGGYQFGDYWRMGLPLDILIVSIAIPAILYFWPL